MVERAQHRVVDELAGHEPRRLQHHALGARAGLLEPLEARHHDGQALGQGQQAHERAGDDGERALAAGHERAQVDGVGVLQPGDRAVAEHDLEAEHVVGRDAVAEAVQAAGVRPDVAADHRGRARGRVGRVAQAVSPRLLVERGVGVPGLHERRALLDVEVEDGLHAVEGDHEAAARGHGRAGQGRAAAARDDRHAVLVRDAHGGGDVLGGLGIDQRLRPADHVRGVARDGGELGRLRVHALAECRAQRCHPRLRHAATMRGTAGSKRSTSRSMRPSSANVHVLVPRLRPAVQPPPSQSAVSTPSLARRRRQKRATALCREARERRVERPRMRPAGQRERTARGEVRGCRSAAGRAEGALEGAHERLGVGEVDGGAVGEGELAAGLGVRRDRPPRAAGPPPSSRGGAASARGSRARPPDRRRPEAPGRARRRAPRGAARSRWRRRRPGARA